MSWVHLLFGLILLISVFIGLFGAAKRTPIWAMVARICYVVLIVSGIFMTKYAWDEKPILTVIKIVIAILVIGLIEMSFAKKTRGEISHGTIWLVILMILIVAGLGLWLSGGYPLI